MYIIEINLKYMDDIEIKLNINNFQEYFNDGIDLNTNYSNDIFEELNSNYQEYNMIEVVNNNSMPNFTYDARTYSPQSNLIVNNEDKGLNYFTILGLKHILNNAKISPYTKRINGLSTIKLKGKIIKDISGGNTKIKKEILGKQRCIYKKAGDRKEYVKYKGVLITVKDYKKILLS